MERIPFLSPSFPSIEEVAADYAAILKSRIYSNGGPFERELANAVTDWIGNETNASLVASATSGLQLAISATFHRHRTFALVASFTFAAAPLAVRWCGYTPTFLDIEPGSWQPSLQHAERYLSQHKENTAGVVLTNTFGTANPVIERWEALAKDCGLPLVIDSAAGFGSEYQTGEPMGARGTCEVFSLHATKTLAVGEGGAVIAKDPRLVSQIDRMKNFGFDNGRSAVVLGTNAKLSELSCAIGLRQLATLRRSLADRRRIFQRYREGLSRTGVVFQPLSEISALPFVSALMPSPEVRSSALRSLENAGVDARTYYNPPVHSQPVFAGSPMASPAMAVTVDLASRILSLPMSDHLRMSEVDRVVRAVVDVL
jgi:dTDP-4-amino-4,6-dideoxygalactose transaminase